MNVQSNPQLNLHHTFQFLNSPELCMNVPDQHVYVQVTAPSSVCSTFTLALSSHERVSYLVNSYLLAAYICHITCLCRTANPGDPGVISAGRDKRPTRSVRLEDLLVQKWMHYKLVVCSGGLSYSEVSNFSSPFTVETNNGTATTGL